MNFKNIIRIIVIISFSLNLSSLNASELIVYVDMNKIMSTSLVAKSLNEKIKKDSEKNIKKFKKTLENLREEENKLLAQKNVLDGNEFQKKIEIIIDNSLKRFNELPFLKPDFLIAKTIKSKALILEKLAMSEIVNILDLILNKKNIIIFRYKLRYYR